MAVSRYDPPGFVDDLTEEQKQVWSDWVSEQLDEARNRDGRDEGLLRYGPRPQFFNVLSQPSDADVVEKDINWTAFPRLVQLRSVSDVQRWRAADGSRDAQDEYCEWSVSRAPDTGKIVRVTFTSEGPEYWQFLAASNPERVIQLYREHVDPGVQSEDLFSGGRYVARNRWNSTTENGAMHLIQRNNTLGAEIELAAAASIVRSRGGTLLTSQQELIQCGRYGQAERHSDPFIGAVVNELARARADVSLANPVGLCIAGLSVAGWQTPDGSDPLDCWKVTRGTKEKALRAAYEVPLGKGFTVGEVKIEGRTIEYGSQIADFIRIKLTGLATRIGKSSVVPLAGCVEEAVRRPGVRSVAAALRRKPFSSRL